MKSERTAYDFAKETYQKYGVDTDQAIDALRKISISIQCWQGDDITGFMNQNAAGGGIQVTGNYPGKARNATQLRNDLTMALSLIPGTHKVNLHAIYAETDGTVALDQIGIEHFQGWIEWAKKTGVGLDFNPTCFGHPMVKDGLTLSSPDTATRNFWIHHCQNARRIGEAFGKALNKKSVVNLWIPDGSKDFPVDVLGPRQRLKESLDQIYAEPLDGHFLLDTVEPKLFGIGLEGYTAGSSEFYLGYAVKNQIGFCLDSGHFHPTEDISDKISSVLLYIPELLLHVSRPMRWDSDHVVMLDDELFRIAEKLVRNQLLDRTHLGLDYFDASINRVAAWVIGARNLQKALLKALLEPADRLNKAETDGNFTARLALTEELKALPFGLVYDHFCQIEGVPTQVEWLKNLTEYETKCFMERE